MTLLHQNVRSLKNKLVDLKTNILNILPCPDIVVFTETWLHDGFLNSELELFDFDIHRQDRNPQNNPSTRGGGVMICTKKQLKAVPILLDNCAVELCGVRITLEHGNVVVIAAYLPPVSTNFSSGDLISKFEALCKIVDNIQSMYPQDRMIVVGDFNLSKVQWGFQDILNWLPIDPVSETIRSAATKLRNLLAPLDMKQFYPLHPNKGYSLDLLFSNLAVEGCISQDPLVRCDEHHIPALFTFEVGVKNLVKFDRIVYNFKKANVQGIVDTLNSVDWNVSLSADSVDDCVAEFYEVLNNAVSANVPLMRIKSSTFPPWYTSELKSCIFKKKEAHALWNISHNPADREEFKRLRALCIRLSRSNRRDYSDKTENSIRRSSKAFWSYVNGLKKPGELPYDMYFKQKSATNNQDIAGLFSERFSEVFAPPANGPPPTFNQVNLDFFRLMFLNIFKI